VPTHQTISVVQVVGGVMGGDLVVAVRARCACFYTTINQFMCNEKFMVEKSSIATNFDPLLRAT
jgi:hypothetical protein